MQENTDRKNSEYGHFLSIDYFSEKLTRKPMLLNNDESLIEKIVWTKDFFLANQIQSEKGKFTRQK